MCHTQSSPQIGIFPLMSGPSLLSVYNIPRVGTPHLPCHSSARGHLGGFHIPAVGNSAAVNMAMHGNALHTPVSIALAQKWGAGSHGGFGSVFEDPPFLQNNYTNLRSQQQSMRVPFPAYLSQSSLSFIIVIKVMLTDVSNISLCFKFSFP